MNFPLSLQCKQEVKSSSLVDSYVNFIRKATITPIRTLGNIGRYANSYMYENTLTLFVIK